MRPGTALSATLAALLVVAAPPAPRAARAEQVTETDADGKVVAKYSVDADGLRHGAAAEFHPNGAVRVKANYRHGRRDGRYTSYHDNGRSHVTAEYDFGTLSGPYVEKDEKGRIVVEASYVAGRLDGDYREFKDGEPVSVQKWKDGTPLDVDGVVPYPRDRDAIRADVEAIFNSKDPLEEVADDPEAKGRGECLRHLKIFRSLCGLPWQDLVLDAQMNRLADAGAALCERIGHLDHTPPNPGMPKEQYEFAYQGTSRSNLYMGLEDIVPQVRGYMDDSDDSNIGAVGHRRWCLNPTMVKTGFGRSGRFAAMYAHDASRRPAPDVDVVAFPPMGWTPDYWFEAHYAWSVSLSPRKWAAPDAGRLRISVTPIGEDHVRRERPLAIEKLSVNTQGAGIPYCVIFRPVGIEVEPGKRYWVEIAGLERGGKPATLRYVVAFFDL